MQTVTLEFRRQGSTNLTANGSDSVTFLDGRWNAASRTNRIHEKLAELRARDRSPYRDLHFVGFSVLGTGRSHDSANPHVRMSDPEPPSWVGA